MVILIDFFGFFMKFVKASSQSAVPWSSTNRMVRNNNIPAQQGFRSCANWGGFYEGFTLIISSDLIGT